MTKEEAWLMWMKESIGYIEYDWDTIKKSSHWQAFSRGWDAASVNTNGWDDAYKMGMEAGKALEQREWQGLTNEEIDWLWSLAFEAKLNNTPRHFARMVEENLKEKNT